MIDIILLEPETPGNVGAICRAVANFGFTNLIIVNPKCNLESDELYRRAKHSKDIVKNIKVRKTMPKYDVLVASTSKIGSDFNVKRSPITPEQLAKKIGKSKKKIGIVFGRESSGLSNEEIAKCDILVSIDAHASYPVLNLSHAVAIILYELHKVSGKNHLLEPITPLTGADRKQITKQINQIIKKSTFQTKQKEQTQKTIWKNVFNKALLTKREAQGVMGLLNRILKKL